MHLNQLPINPAEAASPHLTSQNMYQFNFQYKSQIQFAKVWFHIPSVRQHCDRVNSYIRLLKIYFSELNQVIYFSIIPPLPILDWIPLNTLPPTPPHPLSHTLYMYIYLTGIVAQLVEHPLCDQEVVDLIPGQVMQKTLIRAVAR